MNHLIYSLSDIYAMAEKLLNEHHDLIRVELLEGQTVTLAELIQDTGYRTRQGGRQNSQVAMLEHIAKRLGRQCIELVQEIVKTAIHNRYYTFPERSQEQQRVLAAMLFMGEDSDETFANMQELFDPVYLLVGTMLDTLPDNRYLIMEYFFQGRSINILIGDDLRHVVFRRQYGSGRWRGERYSVKGNKALPDTVTPVVLKWEVLDRACETEVVVDLLEAIHGEQLDEFKDREVTMYKDPEMDLCPFGEGVDVLSLDAVDPDECNDTSADRVRIDAVPARNRPRSRRS